MLQNLHIKLLVLIVFLLLVTFMTIMFYAIKIDSNHNDFKQQLNKLEEKLSRNQVLSEETKTRLKPSRILPKKTINAELPIFLFDSNKHFSSGESQPVFVIEFTNFKCGYCARHHESVFKQIKKNYIDTNKIRYYVFTTTNINDENSVAFSKLYSCNTSPVKLDKFINELFSIAKSNYHNIDEININSLAKYSSNKEEYLKCVNSKELGNNTLILNKHLSSLDINKTPTFLIGRFSNKNNYERLVGALPYDSFSSQIKRLLNDKTK